MTVADQQTRDMDALKRAYKETDEAHKNAVRRNKAIRDLECEIEIRSREEADLYRRASVRSKSGGPSGPNVHKPLPRSPQKGMEEVVSISAEEGLADKMNELRGRMHHAENRAEELTKAIQASQAAISKKETVDGRPATPKGRETQELKQAVKAGEHVQRERSRRTEEV